MAPNGIFGVGKRGINIAEFVFGQPIPYRPDRCYGAFQIVAHCLIGCANGVSILPSVASCFAKYLSAGRT